LENTNLYSNVLDQNGIKSSPSTSPVADFPVKAQPEGEGRDKDDLFKPSLGRTNDGKILSAKVFLRSESCGNSGCHSEILNQWRSSAHHRSSFNNPFYKKTVEILEKQKGSNPVKFCGGCHDPVLLFSGKMEGKINSSTPEAQAGIVCLSCHAIQKISGVRGNAEYVIRLPQKYPFEDQEGPVPQFLNRLLIRVKPGPHRKEFLKPFHSKSQFCGLCHKVSIDVPVNGYRWKRGQNEYDAWQMSGISGHVAAPLGNQNKKGKSCSDCHMPEVESQDMGNKNGKIHHHAFATANTALPHVLEDLPQLNRVRDFLRNNQISIDLIAVRKKSEVSGLQEISDSTSNQDKVWVFPVDPYPLGFRCGEEIIFEVLVKNEGVGHSFPGGTIDAQEVWIEFQVNDERGNPIFHSGFLKEDGKVDPRAHFYGALLLNKKGEPILQRNIQDWIATAYKRVIPPGGSDVVFYKALIPEGCKSGISIKASLQYRKFRPSFTQFALKEEKGKNTQIDPFPVVTMGEFHIQIANDLNLEKTRDSGNDFQKTSDRLNDYGLALFLQGDFRRAEEVFRTLLMGDEMFFETRARLVRVLLADGAIEDAREEAERLVDLDPSSSKGLFLKALVEKEYGNYEEALALLNPLSLQFPNDREVLKQMGRIQFLIGSLEMAKSSFGKALEIDPEDPMVHLNLSLIFEALGDEKQARVKRNLYLKYKDAEEEETLAGVFRRSDLWINREAQKIHVHD